MFEIVPEPEFATWFAALPEPLAEEVATALEVVARAAETLDPPGVSRALLWFDGLVPLASAGGLVRSGPLALVESSNGLQALLAWQRELVTCLESAAFRARLAKLSEPATEAAFATVERLRSELRAWQKQVVLAAGAGHWSAVDPRERRDALMRELTEVLALLGLAPGAFIGLANGLRELVVSTTEPKLRVLFGIDAAGKRLVALLGERLDRAYYGDSVRAAEAAWSRYQLSALAVEELP